MIRQICQTFPLYGTCSVYVGNYTLKYKQARTQEFQKGVLIAATGDLQHEGLGAQPPDADESSISCYLRVA